jgi:hypothetical protein
MNSTTTNNHLINNSSVNATTSKSDPSIDKIVNISVIANSEPVKSIPILTNISKNADVGVITNKAATISEGNKK